MQVKRLYPLLAIDPARMTETRDFYSQHFGFTAVFESDWYIQLVMAERPEFELALIQYSHHSIPEGYRQPCQGLLLTFEVTDVDAVYQRLIVEAGLPLRWELRNEDWGQRHFMTADPNGVTIDVVRMLGQDE